MNLSLTNLRWLLFSWPLTIGKKRRNLLSSIWEQDLPQWKQQFFDFFNDRALFIEYTGETKEIEGRELPICTNSKGVPPKQVIFGGTARKLYNNIVVSDDDDEDDEPEVDDLFLGEDDDESLPDFENIDNLNEDEE
jgi:hypothetical protein